MVKSFIKLVFLAGTVKHEMSVIGVGETFVLAYANCVELQKLKLYFRVNFKRSNRLLKQLELTKRLNKLLVKAKMPALLTFKPIG